jgi:exonuclease V gamma subunit
VVATDCHTVFGEVQDPAALLDELVQGYRDALREPLVFFTQASHAYVAQAIKLETSTRASTPPLEAALAKLRPRAYEDSPPGDLDDPYVSLCWRGRDPLRDAAAEFERRATAFWRPAMATIRGASEAGE